MKKNYLKKTSSFALTTAVSTLYHFEDFECQVLASGGFADVLKAVHVESGHVMVIKQPKKHIEQPIMTKEIEIMMEFSHLNIIKACGVIIDGGQLSIVMEYINGGSLQNYIKDEDNILPWCTRIKLAMDIADGMSHINKMGYLHRDLTSLNILIKIEQNYLSAVVSDFGLATRISKNGKILQSVGTPFCRSPESIRGEYYNQKADVFSFGIILCELILRCDNDPDNLPRTRNYGVDYIKIGEMVEDCPVSFLSLAFLSCHMDMERRPTFDEIGYRLESTLIDYLTCGFPEEEVDEFPVLKRFKSLDDLVDDKLTEYLISDRMDVPVFAGFFDDNTLLETCSSRLSPREVGKTMAMLDSQYTASELNLIELLHRTSPFHDESFFIDEFLTESIDKPDSETVVSEYPKSHYSVHSLPPTRKELKILADRCLQKLPSDKNMKRSDVKEQFMKLGKKNISRTLIRGMPNHGITLPLPIVNFTISSQSEFDSGLSSASYKRKLFSKRSLPSNHQLFKRSPRTFDLSDDLLKKFFSQSSSSLNSSSGCTDEDSTDNDRFCRFMKRYLLACLRSQNPVTSYGRHILFTPESLKRLNAARELFKKIEKYGSSK